MWLEVMQSFIYRVSLLGISITHVMFLIFISTLCHFDPLPAAIPPACAARVWREGLLALARTAIARRAAVGRAQRHPHQDAEQQPEALPQLQSDVKEGVLCSGWRRVAEPRVLRQNTALLCWKMRSAVQLYVFLF